MKSHLVVYFTFFCVRLIQDENDSTGRIFYTTRLERNPSVRVRVETI